MLILTRRRAGNVVPKNKPIATTACNFQSLTSIRCTFEREFCVRNTDAIGLAALRCSNETRVVVNVSRVSVVYSSSDHSAGGTRKVRVYYSALSIVRRLPRNRPHTYMCTKQYHSSHPTHEPGGNCFYKENI